MPACVVVVAGSMVGKAEPRARLLIVQPASATSPKAPKSPKGTDEAGSPQSMASAAVQSSLSLIWAGGYTTNLPPIWQEPERHPAKRKKSAASGAVSKSAVDAADPSIKDNLSTEPIAETMVDSGREQLDGATTVQDECREKDASPLATDDDGCIKSECDDKSADATAKPLPRTKATLLMAAHEKVRVDNSGRITITSRKQPCELWVKPPKLCQFVRGACMHVCMLVVCAFGTQTSDRAINWVPVVVAKIRYRGRFWAR